MKKFLIASTAVVALSGAAAAEITLSGDAQIGLKYDDALKVYSVPGDTTSGVTGLVSGWNLQQRARFTVTMTGETDSGLSFGAKLRPGHPSHKESRDAFETAVTVWAEGAYGKITVGDVDSAIEQAIGDLAGVGNSGLEFYNEFYFDATDAYEGHNNKGLVYSYKYGDATFFASFEDQYVGYSGNKYVGDSWALGASYSMNQYTFGIGYSVGDEIAPGDGKLKTWGLAASGDFNGLTVKGVYLESKDDFDKLKQYGISGDYTMANGVGIQGFYRINDWDYLPGKEKLVGLGTSYDLGGGASVNAGIVHIKADEGSSGLSADGNSWADRTIADFGLRFSF